MNTPTNIMNAFPFAPLFVDGYPHQPAQQAGQTVHECNHECTNSPTRAPFVYSRPYSWTVTLTNPRSKRGKPSTNATTNARIRQRAPPSCIRAPIRGRSPSPTRAASGANRPRMQPRMHEFANARPLRVFAPLFVDGFLSKLSTQLVMVGCYQ